MQFTIDKSYFDLPKPRSLYQRGLNKLHALLSIKQRGQNYPDWVRTPHNKSFSEDEVFQYAYTCAVENTHDDYRIPWRIQQALWAAHHCLELAGDFVELGTGKGFVFHAVMGAMEKWGVRDKEVYLYDVFELFQESGKGRDGVDRVYCDDFAAVQDSFTKYPNVKLVKGDVRETLKPENHPKISFLHVDLNHPETEIACIDLLYDNITSGGIILLDDFANLGFETSFELHTAYFAKRGKRILTTPSGQGIVLM